MRGLRWPGRFLGGCLLVLLLMPSLAAWPSALVDRGPAGSVRVSAFPLGLTLFDPFVWTCARNSALVASATALGSVVVGVGLALVGGRGRFWGRSPLWVLSLAPLAAGPLLIAPSLASALGGGGGWEWLASRSAFGVSAEAMARWAALAWTGMATGVPLVALATLAGSRRVEPAWTEASLAVGSTPRRAWWDVAWPIIRPGVARAAALIFTLMLVEPAGPMILGLRRTLAVQIIHAATRLDQPTRASTLALLAITIAVVARSVIAWGGGAAYSRIDQADTRPAPPSGFRRAMISRLMMAIWCGSTSGLVGLWLWRSFRAGLDSGLDSRSILILGWRDDPEWLTWGANSLGTAGLAVVVDLVILRTLNSRQPGSIGRSIRLACRIFEAIPPLALGVGALAIPWLLIGLADVVGGPLGAGLRAFSLELSPGRSPGWLLILVLAAGQLPMLAEAARVARALIRPARVEASRLMGESDRRASRTGERHGLGVVPFAPAFLALALASTSLAPALLLTPFSERRTLAPAILGLVLEAEPLAPRSLGPIAAWLGINLLALVVVIRGRVGQARD